MFFRSTVQGAPSHLLNSHFCCGHNDTMHLFVVPKRKIIGSLTFTNMPSPHIVVTSHTTKPTAAIAINISVMFPPSDDPAFWIRALESIILVNEARRPAAHNARRPHSPLNLTDQASHCITSSLSVHSSEQYHHDQNDHDEYRYQQYQID